MAHNEPAMYRSAADRRRMRSPSSTDSCEWIKFSQEWEKVAEMTETLSANKFKRANYAHGGSPALGNPEVAKTPVKVFCSLGYFVPGEIRVSVATLSPVTSEFAGRPRRARPSYRLHPHDEAVAECALALRC